MPFYLNDYALPSAKVIQPSTTFLTSNQAIPEKAWSAGAKLGTDQKKLALEIVLGSYKQVEEVRGILEENDVVILHSTSQHLFDAHRTVYAFASSVNVEEQAPGYVLVRAELVLLGTPTTMQPTFQLSSRQVENWNRVVGRTSVCLPGTGSLPTAGAPEARGLSLVVSSPSWANDDTYREDEVTLGEIGCEINFEDVLHVHDVSRSQLHGSGHGALSAYEDEAESGTTFDGQSAQVEIPYASALSAVGGTFTLAARIRPTDFGTGEKRYLLAWGGRLRFYVKTYDAYGFGCLGADVSVGGQWTSLTTGDATLRGESAQDVALTHDGETLRLYVNDALAATLPLQGTLDASEANIYLGSDGQGGHYAGMLARLRLWKACLTGEQLAAARRLEGPAAFPADHLVASWPMDVYAGSLWRNAVRLHDGDANDPKTRVRSSDHRFLHDVWITSDLYQLRLVRSAADPDYRRLLVMDARGQVLEKVVLPNVAQAYGLRVTDDYVALRLDTGHLLELWRGKDPAISAANGSLQYLLSEPPTSPRTPDEGTNHALLGTSLYVAGNREFEIGTDNRIRVLQQEADAKLWFINATSATIAPRAREALKKLV